MVVASALGVSAFGLRIAVLTDCQPAHDYFDRCLLPWLPRSTPDPEAADLVFRVSQNREGNVFSAQAGDRMIASHDTLPAIFELLQRLTDEVVTRGLRDMVAIHAGVVAWNGCAALLPGASHAGKTTLVMELLKRGAVYYSDEYALLDAEGRVHAYPRPLMIRDRGGFRQPTLASAWNAATADSPATVRLILSVEWASEEQWRVGRIPQSEALLVLLKNTPRAMADSPEILGCLRSAASSAICYAGVRGEGAEASEHVMELFAALG